MRNLARVLLIAFFLLIVVAILAFTIENQQLVSLVFLGVTAPPLAMSILILSSFLLGMVLAPILVFLRRNLLKKSKMVKKE
ncbi:DUF1049 domain-containing protein [Pseudomonas fluorescens]|uniref:DUF1049 domain-containing protein n=1 Tax=Pseudomonas fluorescens TaxID=294 RepID=UPI003D076EBE